MRYYGRKIDRLIQKTKFNEKYLSIVFMTFDELTGLYKIDCRIQNGRKGGVGGQYVSEHKTEQEARELIDRIAAQYPGKKSQTVIIFDDLGADDDEGEEESG